MKVSEILKVVGDCERIRGILLTAADLTEKDKTDISGLLWDYRCELMKKEVE